MGLVLQLYVILHYVAIRSFHITLSYKICPYVDVCIVIICWLDKSPQCKSVTIRNKCHLKCKQTHFVSHNLMLAKSKPISQIFIIIHRITHVYFITEQIHVKLFKYYQMFVNIDTLNQKELIMCHLFWYRFRGWHQHVIFLLEFL